MYEKNFGNIGCMGNSEHIIQSDQPDDFVTNTSTNFDINLKAGIVDKVNYGNSKDLIDIVTDFADSVSDKNNIEIDFDIGTNNVGNIGNIANPEHIYSINPVHDIFKVVKIINRNGNSENTANNANGIVDVNINTSNDTIDNFFPGDRLESGFVNDIGDKSPNDIRSVLTDSYCVRIASVANVDVTVNSEYGGIDTLPKYSTDDRL